MSARVLYNHAIGGYRSKRMTVSLASALILLWLLARRRRCTSEKLFEQLADFAPPQVTPGSWRRRLEDELANLWTAQLIEHGRAGAIALTDEGHAAALSLIGLRRRPPKLSWRWVQRRYLSSLDWESDELL